MAAGARDGATTMDVRADVEAGDVEAAIATIVEASPPLPAAQRAMLAILLESGHMPQG
jgi:hypothetical protein